MLDILFRNGLIVDGTGTTPYQGDLGVASGHIVALGRIEGAQAAKVIDTGGLAVAPGFVDMHSHSDLSLPTHPRATSSLLQGITTEVAGSCGWSMAPVKEGTAQSVLKDLTEALIGARPKEVVVDEAEGVAPAWYSFGEYLEYLEKAGIGTNLYPIVGQSLLRAHVVGPDRRRATPGELEAMQVLLRACLEEGARGLSTGRAYAPGANAPTEEIIALCRVVAARDGLYTSHIKDEGSGLIEAVEEAIRIGRESGVRVEVSHHKAVGPANFGKVNRTLAIMEEARQAGIDVTCDVYPYDFAQVYSLLGEVPGVTLAQSQDEIRGLLAKEEFREKTVGEIMKATAREGHPPGFLTGPENIKVVVAGVDHGLEGQDLRTVLGIEGVAGGAAAGAKPGAAGADDTGGHRPAKTPPLDPKWVRTAVDRVAELLLAQNLLVNLAAIMCEDDVASVLGHPETMVGTDAFALDHELGERTPIHPRHYGTFPRALGYFRRTRRVGDLAGLVRKVTALPARKLRLVDRGLLATGNWADIVVFDPGTIADRATAREPYLPPAGIKWVIVNGQVAVEDGKVSDIRAGKVLRR